MGTEIVDSSTAVTTKEPQRDCKGRFLPNNDIGFALGSAGRPPKYTPEEWVTRIAGYFARCNEQDRPYTWAGLALFMRMSREALDNWLKGEYEGRGEQAVYVDCLKAARTAIECQREELLIRRENGNIAGIIFALKAGNGWRDEKHIQLSQSPQRLSVILAPELKALLEQRAGGTIGEIIEGEVAK
jgi:hypothetical protein